MIHFMAKGIFFLGIVHFFSLNVLAEEVAKKEQKGEKLFRKYLRKNCRTTAMNFAQKHTQKEWLKLKERNLFYVEIHKQCHKLKLTLSEGQENMLYSFFMMYAKDSGNYGE